MQNAPLHPPVAESPRSRFEFLGTRFRRVAGWCGDSRRLAWGYLSLNLRKTLFRTGRGRVACPCQNPSDSGRAWETGCDAVASWSSARRFQRLCPLLQQNPAGIWRCSVDTAEVRPFWGRALAFLSVGAVALYLALALGIWSVLHLGVGYPIRYAAVAWPPAWHEIRQGRAAFFFTKAERALKANQPVEAIMWLSQSFELDPGNYTAGRILAQLWQNSQGDVSDRVYRQLLREHPNRRAETAQAWYMALLARGDFGTLSGLSWERLHADPAESSLWLNTLLVASRRLGDLSWLQKAIQTPAGLPPYVPVLCSWELQLRTAAAPLARALLTQSIPADTNPYVFYYRIERLLHAGLADDALRQLALVRDRLAVRDRVSLYLDTYAALGWQELLVNQVDKLLTTNGSNASFIELLSTHLIRHPNPALFTKLFLVLAKQPMVGPDSDKLTAFACVFCAAGVNGDWPRLATMAQALKSVTGARYRTLDTVVTYFHNETSRVPLERYLPVMPQLPVDTTLALYEFSDRQRAATPAIKVKTRR